MDGEVDGGHGWGQGWTNPIQPSLTSSHTVRPAGRMCAQSEASGVQEGWSQAERRCSGLAASAVPAIKTVFCFAPRAVPDGCWRDAMPAAAPLPWPGAVVDSPTA